MCEEGKREWANFISSAQKLRLTFSFAMVSQARREFDQVDQKCENLWKWGCGVGFWSL